MQQCRHKLEFAVIGVCAVVEGKRTSEAEILSIRMIATIEAIIFVFEILAFLFVKDSICFFSPFNLTSHISLTHI